jgi:flagellum-specific peptidoglycan hydrolase FlgJ/type II secretory pathway component PulJ
VKPSRPDAPALGRGADAESALVLQRMAGNRALARLLARPARSLQRVGGWHDAAAHTINAEESVPRGTGVRRIPVEGIEGGGTATGGSSDESAAGGKAIVVLPEQLPASVDTVDVVLHYHGTNLGYRRPRGGGQPHDLGVDRIEQQLGALNRAGGRPWVAVLPQGWAQQFGSGPGGSVPAGYLENVWKRLGEIGAWGGRRAPARGRVALSSHSGGDVPTIGMLGKPGHRTDFAAHLDALFLFDTMYTNGNGRSIVSYLRDRLGRDLDALRPIAASTSADAQQRMIDWIRQHGFRLYGVESSDARHHGSFYHSRFEMVRNAITAFFENRDTIAVLGPAAGAVAQAMRANLQIGYSGGEHDRVLGDNDALEHALQSVGSAPAGAGPATPPPAPTAPAPARPAPTPVPAPVPAPAHPAPAPAPARPAPAPVTGGGGAAGPATARPAQTAVPTQAQVTALAHVAADVGAPAVVERVVTAATGVLGTSAASEDMWDEIRIQFTSRHPTVITHVPAGPLAGLKRELHSAQTVREINALGARKSAALTSIFDRLLPLMAPAGPGNAPPTLEAEIDAEVRQVSRRLLDNVAGDDRHRPSDRALWLTVRQGILASFGAFEIGAAAAIARANAYYASLRHARLLGVNGPLVHHKMQERLNRANALMEARLTDAEKAEVRTTLRDWGGFAIRPNSNNRSVLSLHSFGWAVDIDAAFNPNYGHPGAGSALATVAAVTGRGDPRQAGSARGRSFADARAAAAELHATSAAYVDAMQDEPHLGRALVAFANRSRPAGSPALAGNGSDLIAAAGQGRGASRAVLDIISAGAAPPQAHALAGAADTIVSAVSAFRASFTTRRGRTERVGARTEGSAGSTAAHGFFRLPPQLVAALVSSEGGGLVWLGTSGVHDWMHFELPASDRSHLLVRPDQDRLLGEAAAGEQHTNSQGAPIAAPAATPPRAPAPAPQAPAPAPAAPPAAPAPSPAPAPHAPAPAPAPHAPAPAAPTASYAAPPAMGQGVTLTAAQLRWITRNPHTIRFYRRFAAAALEAQRRSGVPAVVTLAQGAIESGWGRSARGNMLFGVKVRASTPADHRQVVLTWEEGQTQAQIDHYRALERRERAANPGVAHPKYEITEVLPDTDRAGQQRKRDGQPLFKVHIYLEFARYDSAVEAIEDHNATLHGRPYRAAWTHTADPEEFARAVARGGYATEHDYESALVNMLHTINRLAAFDRDHAKDAERLGGPHGDVNAELTPAAAGAPHPAAPAPPAPAAPAPPAPAPAVPAPAPAANGHPHVTPAPAAAQPFGIDYASRPPHDAALAQNHVQFVCRYLSYTHSKNLTAREAQHMSSLGISLVGVWETTANRALAGRAAGASDARQAMSQATAVGQPGTRPIYFAVDFDATKHQLEHQVAEYFQGVTSVLGADRTGVYGGYRTVKALFDAGLVTYGWQTYAWSHGHWDPRAQLQQYRNSQHVDHVDVDFDRAVSADFGQWTTAPAAAPVH